MRQRYSRLLLATALSLATSCTGAASSEAGNITLPEGFSVTVFADDLGPARHMAVAANGDVYVALRKSANGGGVVALRDTDGDGRANRIEYFSDVGGSGLALHDGALYLGTVTTILRFELGVGLVPKQPAEIVVTGMPRQGVHNARSLAINAEGELFVNIGAPSNACQEQDRAPSSPGMRPCPLLDRHGGIWRFDAGGTKQVFSPVQRYATGLRNAVALDWDAGTDKLYLVMHGRDQLHQLWPDLYTIKESAHLPAEQFFAVDADDNLGWPYCYYNPFTDTKVLAPEYGGNGRMTGNCGQYQMPIVAFPAHWAPNALLFYRAEAFPEPFSGGAFVAFHGSWNRTPLPQKGYKVVFVPFENGEPTGGWRVFADGFAGEKTLQSPGNADYRPTGLAIGPDGALYISDDTQGRIWRITHEAR